MKIIYDVSCEDIVTFILDKKIGVIYQGRSEVGPRALGNRSIIFDPRISNGKTIVNTVKKRENYRPFAGSILEEYAHEWFDMIGLKRSPFMSFNLKVKEERKKEIPAIIHVDGTCRIQTVNKIDNPHYYKLIETFYKETQVPMLLNTSFNLSNQAMVETIPQAIQTLSKSSIDYIYFPDVKMIVVK